MAFRIAGWILKYQDLLTKWISGRTGKWSPNQQWIFLCVVCFILGGASILAMVQSFRLASTENTVITGAASSSVQTLPPEAIAIISKEEFEAAKLYKAEHPGLLLELPDLYQRLSLIEAAYYSQIKK